MRIILAITASLLLLWSCLTVILPFRASGDDEQLLIDSTFEDGAVGNWAAFGGGSLSLDSSAAHSGSASLKISGRSNNYEGPSVYCNSIFRPNETYSFEGWAYQNSGGDQTMKLTIRFMDSYGSAAYENIGTVTAHSGEWTLLSGSVTVREDAVSYLVYFESEDGEIDFSIDDVKIFGADNSVGEDSRDGKIKPYFCDFEKDGDTWAPRGDIRIMRTDEYSNSGKYSILATNRKEVWNGPMLSISDKIVKGRSFYYAANVMYNGEEYEDSHVFRLELQYTIDGTDHYDLVNDKTVRKNKWTKLSGYYTVPEEAENVYLYVQTDNIEEDAIADIDDLMPFYVDDVKIADGTVMNRRLMTNKAIKIVIAVVSLTIIGLMLAKLIRRIRRHRAALRLILMDAMTKVGNRNAFERRKAELNSSPEELKGLYFGLCDVNFLKYINDNFGHAKGDESIIRCANALKSAIGRNGEIYRVGGDEFIFIARMPIEDAVMKALVDEAAVDKGYPFSAACGFGSFDGAECCDVDSIIGRCDGLMYEHKKQIKAENSQYSRQ